jgi:3-phenylpropionate/cinnamic acid dioxygenase small subunit
MLFPNLFIAEIQLFVLQPLAVDETVQHVTAVQFKGAPDMNRRMLQQTIGSVGPAGFLLADDSEMYERNQRGVQARSPEWLQLSVGSAPRALDENGHPIADATDELPQRAMWRHYKQLMADCLMSEAVDLDLLRRLSSSSTSRRALPTSSATTSGRRCGPTTRSTGCRPAPTTSIRTTQMSIIFDNRSRIGTRIKQLQTGKRHAQTPPSRTAHMISNVELLASDDDDVQVGANFLVYESRERGVTLWAGRTEWTLRRGDDGFQIARKKVMLANNDRPLSTLAFLL